MAASDIGKSSHASTIKAFLKCPSNNSVFDDFFALSYRICLTTLRSLRHRGYSLPFDNRTDTDPLRDLAIDILSDLFDKKSGRPYYVVFDYFRAQRLLPPDKVADCELVARLFGLVRGFTRQTVWRFKNEQDPQIANLKKRINDILKDAKYRTWSDEIGVEYVASGDAPECPDLPDVSVTELYNLVRMAFEENTSRVEWCRRVFELLSKIENVRQRIRKSDILTAMIAVNIEAVELDQAFTSHPGSPINELLRSELKREANEVLNTTTQKRLAHFVIRGKLTEDESSRLGRAVGQYFEELIETGNKDKLPQFFRENMPDEAHGRYLKDYKHVLDTVIDKSLAEFRKRLQANPIIRAFGYYLPDDGTTEEV